MKNDFEKTCEFIKSKFQCTGKETQEQINEIKTELKKAGLKYTRSVRRIILYYSLPENKLYDR